MKNADPGCRRQWVWNAPPPPPPPPLLLALFLLWLSPLAWHQVNADAADANRIPRPAAVAPLNSFLTAAVGADAAADPSLESCSTLRQRVQDQERLAYVAYPPDFKGSWVSQECETRPGPEFLLRHYHFERDGTFKLVQHYYGDEWCTQPVYTLSARGHLAVREPSWIVPGGSDVEYSLHRVTVTAHGEDAVDDIVQKLNRTCPGFVNRPWRARKEYTIYNSGEEEERQHGDQELIRRRPKAAKKLTNDVRPKRVPPKSAILNDANETMDEKDCLHALHVVFHELQLMRTVRRSVGADSRLARFMLHNQKPLKTPQLAAQTQLYLGDVHPKLEDRASYRPTAYQPPLSRQHEVGQCTVCRSVAKSTEKSPAHLHARPRLPVYPAGHWISTQCETRPIGTFLMRRFHFVDHPAGFSGAYGQEATFQTWFHYFQDAACTNPTLSVVAGGRYAAGAASATVAGATDFDFFVRTVSITVHDAATARNLNGLKGNRCGLDGSWRVNQAQDVTSTGGCAGLGIRVPSMALDLLRVDVDAAGQTLLSFGDVAVHQEASPTTTTTQPPPPPPPQSQPQRRQPTARPTSDLPALRQCRPADGFDADAGDDDDVDTFSNMLPLIPHARTAAAVGAGRRRDASVGVWLPVAVAICRLFV